jgi:hypothetical protein
MGKMKTFLSFLSVLTWVVCTLILLFNPPAGIGLCIMLLAITRIVSAYLKAGADSIPEPEGMSPQYWKQVDKIMGEYAKTHTVPVESRPLGCSTFGAGFSAWNAYIDPKN